MNENATLLMLSFLSYASNNLAKKNQEALGFLIGIGTFLVASFGRFAPSSFEASQFTYFSDRRTSVKIF